MYVEVVVIDPEYVLVVETVGVGTLTMTVATPSEPVTVAVSLLLTLLVTVVVVDSLGTYTSMVFVPEPVAVVSEVRVISSLVMVVSSMST